MYGQAKHAYMHAIPIKFNIDFINQQNSKQVVIVQCIVVKHEKREAVKNHNSGIITRIVRSYQRDKLNLI
jgi:hypothetical protein